MDFETIKKRHQQDLVIGWLFYGICGAIAIIAISCVVVFTKMKSDPQVAAPEVQQQNPERNPADVGQADDLARTSEVIRLREENAMLRAALIDAQQKNALLQMRKPPVSKSNLKVAAILPAKATKPNASIKKVAKPVVPKKIAKKKPKVIQVSFDETRIKN